MPLSPAANKRGPPQLPWLEYFTLTAFQAQRARNRCCDSWLILSGKSVKGRLIPKGFQGLSSCPDITTKDRFENHTQATTRASGTSNIIYFFFQTGICHRHTREKSTSPVSSTWAHLTHWKQQGM